MSTKKSIWSLSSLEGAFKAHILISWGYWVNVALLLEKGLQVLFLNFLWLYPELHVKYFHPTDVFGQFYVSVRS